MSSTTLSFRATSELAEQTRALAHAAGLSSSDYVREAVREKNEQMLKERVAFLSRALASRHLAENRAMDDAAADGLG